jgi:hypothetical protein
MRASACETDWSYACETHFVATDLALLSSAGASSVEVDGTGEGSRARQRQHRVGTGGFDDDGVYLYEFSAVSSSSGLVLHGADLAYVFGTVTNATSLDAPAVSAEVQKLWADFARTGVPSDSWPRWTAESPRLLNITAPKSYVTAPADTCDKFFEPHWDYYETCMPNNPDLQP